MDAADSESYPLVRFFTVVPALYSLLAEGSHIFITATLIQYWAVSSSSAKLPNARTSSNKDFL
jgi:hypothetical protein